MSIVHFGLRTSLSVDTGVMEFMIAKAYHLQLG
jgi:hypothetical protein